jgi:transcriptional regulator with XRE-family HTH domain
MNHDKDVAFRQAVGKALKLLRTAKGMKQLELAKKIGVQKNYVSMVENGHREPSLTFLQAAASALGASIDMFFVFTRDASDLPSQSAMDYARLQQLLLQLAQSSHDVKPR